MPRSHTLLIFFFCFTLTFLPIPTQAANATCPYDLDAATGMISPTCYANSTTYTTSTTGCCWQVYAAFLFAATRYANLTSSAFLPAPAAAACAAAFPALLLSRRLLHPSLLSNNSCSLGTDSLTLDASPSPCHYSTVNAVTAAVNLTNPKLLCTSPLANLTNNQTSCKNCQTAVIAAVFSLLNITNSKQIVPCGMAATIAIWSPTNPDIPTFQSFVFCLLQILENVGTLGTSNLIPSPPPPLNPHHPPPLTRTGKSTRSVTIAVASASAAAVSLAAIVCLIFAMYRRRRQRSTAVTTVDGELTSATFAGSPLPTEGLYIFTKAELKQATNDYDERRVLGEGAAGKVYLGRLPSGHHVAIKRINKEKKIAEFYREVEILAKLRHPNLTTLVGYCMGRKEHVLVYEYMAGGNLARALHAGRLPWRRRLAIAADVAEGLVYLHEFPAGSVVHRDVKPSNVLLSSDFGSAKLSDFGVSRIMAADATHVSTEVRGTMGYMDPDSFHVGHVSEAADVYSFGVMMLEMVTGMRAVVPTPSGGAESIVHAAREAVSAAAAGVGSIVDPRLGPAWDRASVGEVFDMACRCVRPYKEERPTMGEVLVVLKRVGADVEGRLSLTEEGGDEYSESLTSVTATMSGSTPSDQARSL